MFDLKFSDVLRSAEGKYTQCYGMGRQMNEKKEYSYCAMSIVSHLLFGPKSGDVVHPFGLNHIGPTCPVCTNNGGYLHIIAHINDEHKWSFGKIADWLQYRGY